MSLEFGEHLRELRRRSGFTQKQVAQELHIDRSTYAYYECGNTEPSLVTVRKLAKVFDVSLEELLPDTDNKRFAKAGDSGEFPITYKTAGEEKEDTLLRLYRTLSPQKKRELEAYARRIKRNE